MEHEANARLRKNLDAVEERIAAACARAGRMRDDVTLIAVTKTVSPEVAAILPELGVCNLGESRPQVLWQKAEMVTGVRWHLIGHLQRNKVERTLPLASWIHSVDSLRLLQTIETEAEKQARTIPVLLEINASHEESKHGFSEAEWTQLPALAATLKHVHIRGLMTMAALQDAEQCRPTFIALREMRDRMKRTLPLPHACEHLSMGMSNDYEVAIEEGATFIRLGTILFEGVA